METTHFKGSVVFEGCLAPAKILLHANKHQFNSVSGCLIGMKHEGRLLVTDAIPLFHEHLYLTPFFELAIEQVRFHCLLFILFVLHSSIYIAHTCFNQIKQSSSFIVGYYLAEERNIEM